MGNEGMSTANTTHSSKVLVSGYNSDIALYSIQSNTLVRQEVVSLTSGGPAHLLVDLDSNLVYTANYGGGTVTVVSIEEGKLDKVVQVLEYGPGCRDHPHP